VTNRTNNVVRYVHAMLWKWWWRGRCLWVSMVVRNLTCLIVMFEFCVVCCLFVLSQLSTRESYKFDIFIS
jgi:fumarate reductase subunit C